MMLLRVAGQSATGRVREHNEDHFCIAARISQAAVALELATDAPQFAQHGMLLCVADGMGGYSGGELASRWALEALAQLYYAAPLPPAADGLAAHVRHCLGRMRELLAAKLASEPELSQAGTTLAGIALAPPEALCLFHIGDSRVLRFAGGSHGFLRQLTVDHTPLGAALFNGGLSEADAARDPQCGQLTRALGLSGNTEVQFEGGLSWAAGDMFVLCSDGMHSPGRGLPKAQLQDALRLQEAPAEAVPALLAQAIAADGSDNATLIIAHIDETDIPAEGIHAGG
jgi:PPM family protein phosphatase